MPQITIAAIGQEKQSKFGAYFGIKVGDEWLNVSGNRDESLKGKTFEAEIKQSGKYKWAKLTKEVVASNGHGPGGIISWWHYAEMAKLAHGLASELEPDQTGNNPPEDRSQARAAIMNTVMIAFSNGKVSLPVDDDAVPPPDDGPMPF